MPTTPDLSAFTGFDYVVLTLIGLLAIGGLMRGFTQEAISLAGWVAAAVVVRFFHEEATSFLAPKVGGEASGAIIAFLLLFFGTLILARIIAGSIGGAARRSAIGPLDRLLGLGFGALKGILLASVLFLLTQFSTGLFDPERTPPDWLMKSRSAPLLALSANAMVGWVHDLQDTDGTLGIPGLPPGHPLVEPGQRGPSLGGPSLDEPPGDQGPRGRSPSEDKGGYSPEDREALDRLLEKGETTDI